MTMLDGVPCPSCGSNLHSDCSEPFKIGPPANDVGSPAERHLTKILDTIHALPKEQCDRTMMLAMSLINMAACEDEITARLALTLASCDVALHGLKHAQDAMKPKLIVIETPREIVKP